VAKSRNPDIRGSGLHRWLPRGFDLRWDKDDEDHHIYEALNNLRSFATGSGAGHDLHDEDERPGHRREVRVDIMGLVMDRGNVVEG
jgi:hypothetical protein